MIFFMYFKMTCKFSNYFFYPVIYPSQITQINTDFSLREIIRVNSVRDK